MSKWITDRRPTEDDAYNGWVWVTTEHSVVLLKTWDKVFGRPWQPIVPPEPYVKPKRWWVVWSEFLECWAVRERKTGATIYLRDDTIKVGLINRDERDREAAERIAAIYEEMMP